MLVLTDAMLSGTEYGIVSASVSSSLSNLSFVQIDPTPYTAWGVLGALVFVVVILGGVVWKLFVRQSLSQETRDKILMDFVDRHRSETTTSMKEVAQTVSSSHDKMIAAFAKQARALDEVLLSGRVLDQIEKMKSRGVNLTQEEIERIVKSVLHERTSSRSGDFRSD